MFRKHKQVRLGFGNALLAGLLLLCFSKLWQDRLHRSRPLSACSQGLTLQTDTSNCRSLCLPATLQLEVELAFSLPTGGRGCSGFLWLNGEQKCRETLGASSLQGSPTEVASALRSQLGTLQRALRVSV